MSKKLRKKKKEDRWKSGELAIANGLNLHDTYYLYYPMLSIEMIFIVGSHDETILGLGYYEYTLSKINTTIQAITECDPKDFEHISHFMSKKEFLRRYKDTNSHKIGRNFTGRPTLHI